MTVVILPFWPASSALSSLSGFLIAGAVAWGLSLLVRRWARRRVWISRRQGGRAGPGDVPLGGGLAVLGGVVAGAGVVAWADAGQSIGGVEALTFGLLAGAFGLIGLADDLREAPPGLRLAAEAAIAVGVGIWLSHAGPEAWVSAPAGIGALAAWSLLLVVCANAFNLIDNSDGLAAGTGAMTFLGLAALDGPPGPRIVALLLAGALSGFWLWNRPPARLYLGDLGTLAVGALAGVLIWIALGAGELAGAVGGGGGVELRLPPIARIGALGLIAGYLIFDPLYTVFGRLGQGRAPWRGGVDHLAHDLARRCGGWGHALRLILGVQAFSVGSGLLWLLPQGPGAAMLVALVPWAVLLVAARGRPRALR
ncbi:MAG: undecaprenyl/decaprenyl-phosphate alpha-N-acetylglucosaminyl 1-phosphate transferase [Candidatus Eisenbacteria sp.]|nr:undecaprenyl/decaprenyl-phosphate alpha-N-acetylglucosaminyl 1-phosphate transferase [Candidatus Eisenbacteria bacterium]